MNNHIHTYIRELELRLLDKGESLPAMREDIKDLLERDQVSINQEVTKEYIATYWDSYLGAYSYIYLNSEEEKDNYLNDDNEVITIIDITNAPIVYEHIDEEGGV